MAGRAGTGRTTASDRRGRSRRSAFTDPQPDRKRHPRNDPAIHPQFPRRLEPLDWNLPPNDRQTDAHFLGTLLAPKKPGRVVKGGIDSESDNEKNLVSQGFRVAAGGFEPTTFGLSLSRMMIIVAMISQLFPFFWRLSEKGSKAHGR